MNKLIYGMLFFCFLLSVQDVCAANRKNKKKSDDKKTELIGSSDYKKLLQGKSVKHAKGLMDLYLVDGKLYMELPSSLLEKDMMLASVVSEISDHTDCYVGMNSYIPLRVYFTRIGKHVQLRRNRNQSMAGNHEANIERAIAKNNVGAIMASFEVKAYNADSSAVVIDMTKFFTGNERMISAIDPRSESLFMMRGVNYQLVDESCAVEDVKAFRNNVSVKSRLTYNSKVNMYNRYTTAMVTRTLALLPGEPMRPRLADYRLPLQVLGKWNYKGDFSTLSPTYYALRWRIEPKDQVAYEAGQQVEPKNPIVFYLDTILSPVVRRGITMGIMEWNKTFEAIGFKNVIQVKDYPRNDASFDPDNFAYNCVRYVPTLASGVKVRTFADPRTGEILNTKILVAHNYVVNIPYNVFLNMAHADPSARTRYVSDERMVEDIRNYFAWLTGTECLGMTYNLTSSAAFPIDSLRSAAFTKKYGTSPSILDLAGYNTVAPVDGALKGIRLTPVGVGEYDYHVVKWLYSPIPGTKTPEEELSTLTKWVSEKMGNPIYRYEYAKDCPDCGANDVGDDDLKAYAYGVENLKYMIQNFDKWISNEEDPEFEFRNSMYLYMQRQYKKMITQVAIHIFGIYTYEKKAGDPFPAYRYIDKAHQLKALNILFDQLERPDWLDRKDLATSMELDRTAIEGHKDYMMLLINVVAGKLFAYEHVKGDHLTHSDYIRCLYDRLFEKTRMGLDITEEELYYQNYFFRTMMGSSRMVDRVGNKQGNAQALHESGDYPFVVDLMNPEDIAACDRALIQMQEMKDDREQVMAGSYGELKTWPLFNVQSTRHVYYVILKDMRSLVSKQLNTGSETTRKHYRYMYDSICRLLD